MLIDQLGDDAIAQKRIHVLDKARVVDVSDTECLEGEVDVETERINVLGIAKSSKRLQKPCPRSEKQKWLEFVESSALRSNFLALGDEREKAGGGRGGLGRCEERQGVGHEFISDRLVAQQLCECHIERACGRDKTQVGLEAQPWRVEVACFDLTRRLSSISWIMGMVSSRSTTKSSS